MKVQLLDSACVVLTLVWFSSALTIMNALQLAHFTTLYLGYGARRSAGLRNNFGHPEIFTCAKIPQDNFFPEQLCFCDQMVALLGHHLVRDKCD